MTHRALAVALVVVFLAPPSAAQDGAAAGPRSESFALRNAPDARWSRRAESLVTLRLGPESDPELAIEIRRTVETEVRVITLAGSRLSVWDDVCGRAETVTGETRTPLAQRLRTTDPVAGTTIRYRVVGDGFEGARMKGNDMPLLRAYLSVPHPSGLREGLLPTAPMRVGETRTITGGGPDTVAFVAPVLARPVGGLELTLTRVVDTAGPRIVRLDGKQRLLVRQRAPTIGDATFETDARVSVDFDAVGGHLRTLSIEGAEVTQVRRGEKTLPFAVMFQVTERIVRLPDDAAAPEPVPARAETLEPVFDDRKWTLGHEEAKGDHSIAEWVTDGESVDNWTELVTVHTYPRGDGPILETLLAALQNRQRKVEPKSAWTILEDGDEEIVYEWTLEDGREFPDQHELGRLVLGASRVLQIRYTRYTTSKRGKLTAETRAAWLDRLRRAKPVGEAASASPVPPPTPGTSKTIVPLFDERDWRHVGTEDRGPGSRTDYAIAGDEARNELVSVLTQPRSPRGSLASYFRSYSLVRSAVVKGTTFTKVSEDEREIVYESKRPASALGGPGHELGRIVLSGSQFLHLRYIAKTPELTGDARHAWLVRVRLARVAPVD